MNAKKTKQKKFISLLLLFSLAASSAMSQVNRQWSSSYNGTGNGVDYVSGLAVDASGNVLVTGWSTGTTFDYATVKYNSAGVQQWVQRYDGANFNDRALAIAVDASGNVYVTGISEVVATGSDYLTIKYNSSGTVLWTKRYDGGISGTDQATSIAVDAAGNVFVTGSSSAIAGTADFVTIKYNSSGVQQWVKAFTGSGTGIDMPAALVIDAASNVYVTGKSYEGSGTGYDYLTVKYNSSGALQWFKKYAAYNANEDGATAIAVDSTGNVYVTGISRMGISASTSDYATIKYNSTGTQVWASRYNGPAAGEDDAYSVGVDGAGNVYVTGQSYGTGTSFDYATIKYNSSGIQQWVQRENGPANQGDWAKCLAIDASGNVYVTGSSSGGSSVEDYLTVKYNSSGVQLWSQRENDANNGADVASFLKLDNLGNVYVTGYTTTGTGPDFTTVKYTQPLGITPISTEIPSSFGLCQNYPNPFNPVTNIKFSIPKSGLVKLTVFDITGKEIVSLINQNLNAGSYNYDFDGSNLASGIYIYKLTTDGFTDVKKMMLVK